MPFAKHSTLVYTQATVGAVEPSTGPTAVGVGERPPLLTFQRASSLPKSRASDRRARRASLSSFWSFSSSCLVVLVVSIKYPIRVQMKVREENERKIASDWCTSLKIYLIKPCFRLSCSSFRGKRSERENICISASEQMATYPLPPPPRSPVHGRGLAFTCISLLASVTSPSHLNHHTSIASSHQAI